MPNSSQSRKNLSVYILLVLTAAFFTFYKVPLGDIWIHLAQGRYILQTGVVPDTDVLSFTYYGQPWSNWEWLHNVLSVLCWRAFSFNGIILLRFFIAVGILLMLYHTNLSICNSTAISYGLASFSLVLFQLRITERPVFISYFFLALIVLIVWRSLYDRKHVWLVLLLMIIWRNTHPSWIFGLAVWLGGYLDSLIKGEQDRAVRAILVQIMFFLLILVSAIFVTPVPFDLSSYSLLQSSKNLGEWAALYDRHYTIILKHYIPFLVFSLFLLPLALIRSKGRPFYRLLTGAMVVNAFLHERFVADAIILGMPLVAQMTREIALHTLPRVKSGILVVAILALTLFWGQLNFSLYPFNRGLGVDETMNPIYVAEFMKEYGLKGHLYSSHTNAMEFLAFYLSPAAKVTVDIRVPGLYPLDFAAKYADINNESDFKTDVLTLPLDYIVLGRPDILAWQEHDFYFERLLLREGWQLLYFDLRFALYQAPDPATEKKRKSPPPFTLLARWNFTEEVIAKMSEEAKFQEVLSEIKRLKHYTAGRDDFYREVMVALYSSSSLNDEQKKALEELFDSKRGEDADI
ncbi:MAG TPA: hypothetical protein PLV42_06010 [bacterium]|nr:hypothetical protein [bacterium]